MKFLEFIKEAYEANLKFKKEKYEAQLANKKEIALIKNKMFKEGNNE